MKVNIGNYVNFYGPYQIAEKILFWKDVGDDVVHKFGTWLATNKTGEPSRFAVICNWIYSKQKRTIKVEIDKYDVWSMDTTLSHIILPMLKELKKQKQGSPFIDDSDVPDAIKSTSAKPKINEWDTDEFFHLRWEYVLDELLWAFEQQIDSNSENQFYDHSDVDVNSVLIDQIHSIKIDQEGLAKHNARKQKSFELFGKYFMNLWT